MGIEYGVFEVLSSNPPLIQAQNQEQSYLNAQREVEARYSSFLEQAQSSVDFKERYALVKQDVFEIVKANLPPLPKVMRRVEGHLKSRSLQSLPSNSTSTSPKSRPTPSRSAAAVRRRTRRDSSSVPSGHNRLTSSGSSSTWDFRSTTPTPNGQRASTLRTRVGDSDYDQYVVDNGGEEMHTLNDEDISSGRWGELGKKPGDQIPKRVYKNPRSQSREYDQLFPDWSDDFRPGRSSNLGTHNQIGRSQGVANTSSTPVSKTLSSQPNWLSRVAGDGVDQPLSQPGTPFSGGGPLPSGLDNSKDTGTTCPSCGASTGGEFCEGCGASLADLGAVAARTLYKKSPNLILPQRTVSPSAGGAGIQGTMKESHMAGQHSDPSRDDNQVPGLHREDPGEGYGSGSDFGGGKHAPTNGWTPTCPNCNYKFPDDEDELEGHSNERGTGVICPSCGTESDIDGESGSTLIYSMRDVTGTGSSFFPGRQVNARHNVANDAMGQDQDQPDDLDPNFEYPDPDEQGLDGQTDSGDIPNPNEAGDVTVDDQGEEELNDFYDWLKVQNMEPDDLQNEDPDTIKNAVMEYCQFAHVTDPDTLLDSVITDISRDADEPPQVTVPVDQVQPPAQGMPPGPQDPNADPNQMQEPIPVPPQAPPDPNQAQSSRMRRGSNRRTVGESLKHDWECPNGHSYTTSGSNSEDYKGGPCRECGSPVSVRPKPRSSRLGGGGEPRGRTASGAPGEWLDDDLAGQDQEECPDCGYQELQQDSDPAQNPDGQYDVSCPACNWRGKTYDSFRASSSRTSSRRSYRKRSYVPDSGKWSFDHSLQCYTSSGENGSFTCPNCDQHHPKLGFNRCGCGKVWTSWAVREMGPNKTSAQNLLFCHEITERPYLLSEARRTSVTEEYDQWRKAQPPRHNCPSCAKEYTDQDDPQKHMGLCNDCFSKQNSRSYDPTEGKDWRGESSVRTYEDGLRDGQALAKGPLKVITHLYGEGVLHGLQGKSPKRYQGRAARVYMRGYTAGARDRGSVQGAHFVQGWTYARTGATAPQKVHPGFLKGYTASLQFVVGEDVVMKYPGDPEAVAKNFSPKVPGVPNSRDDADPNSTTEYIQDNRWYQEVKDGSKAHFDKMNRDETPGTSTMELPGAPARGGSNENTNLGWLGNQESLS